jgi:DtxR family Mn-dependent transcriptional regulator
MHSQAEENYLKSIYHLSGQQGESVSTNSIAVALNTRAASVTDMLKKLAEKKLINYARYQGVSLTPMGAQVAINIVRKHRLWEFFLVDKLHYRWDEVHELAEELEHITSVDLVNRLDQFLDFPQYDPHGDPIPDNNGRIRAKEFTALSALKVNNAGVITGVRDHSTSFLQYLERLHLTLGKHIEVIEIVTYDYSVMLKIDDKHINISHEAAKNILVDL